MIRFPPRSSNDNSEPPGVSYVADVDGRIVDCDSWSAVAVQNGASAPASGVGLNVKGGVFLPER